MAKGIKPDELEAELNRIVNEYSKDVIKASQEAVDTVGKAGLTRLQEIVRRAGIGGRKYINSFKLITERGRMGASVILFSTQYQLTHLLEYGHVKVVYGHKVGGKTRAFPHWQQAEEYTNQLLESTIKKAIEGE